jgi:hypothetical protein
MAIHAGKAAVSFLTAPWMRSLRPPVVATPALMSAVTGGMYLSGGVLALIVSFLEQDEHNLGAQRVIAVVGLCIGMGLVFLRHRPSWTYHVLNVLGTCLITLMLVLTGGGDAAEALAILYVFVTLDSFFFFPWQLGLVYHLWAVASVSCAVAVYHVLSLPVGIGLVVIQTAAAWIVGWLVRVAGDSEIDSVTGLANRRGLDRALSATSSRLSAMATR